MSKQPNILFVMTDQQRWDALGCCGGWVQTPNLDRIAAGGIRFDHCVTTSPVCVPARLSMATGHYPHNTGVWNNTHHAMPNEQPTWMQDLRTAGYRTSLFGKTHLHPHGGGDLRLEEPRMHAYGIDDVDEIGGPRASARLMSHMTARWQKKGIWKDYQDDYAERFANVPYIVRPSPLPLEEYADVYVGSRAAEYLRDYQRAEPWFCWVSFGGPHEPWDTPEPYASMHDPASMPPPATLLEDPDGRPRGNFDQRRADMAKQVALPPEMPARLRADYAGKVTLIDEQIGRLLQVIEARGELDNTIIAFTSDHGELNGDYGCIYKETFTDGAVRVPFIVNTPATRTAPQAGSVSDALVEWFDMGPTLVELAGGVLDHQSFARSVVPLLSNPDAEHRPYAISEYRREIMIMDPEWKLMLNRDTEPYMLFNRQDDPAESRNRVLDPACAEVVSRLREQALVHVATHQVLR